jgi:hypothetical protein
MNYITKNISTKTLKQLANVNSLAITSGYFINMFVTFDEAKDTNILLYLKTNEHTYQFTNATLSPNTTHQFILENCLKDEEKGTLEIWDCNNAISNTYEFLGVINVKAEGYSIYG